MVDDKYYEQSLIWGNSPEQYQAQVLFDILDMLPEDVQSILDIGCGDGYITNNLPENIHVVGVDISQEALKHVHREKLIGSITDIPYSNNSFDLVMVNDVIEHLPDNEYRQAISELQRVASKYIMITVPHNEQLESKQTKCADCGTVYHINWHQRSYDEETLKGLLSTDKWKIREVRYTGTTTLPPFDPTIVMQQSMGFFSNWDGAVCPNCNSKRQVKFSETENITLRVIESLRHKKWYSKNAVRVNRSELIMLCENNNYRKNPLKQITLIKETQGSLCEVDFTNKLQNVEQDFTPGSEWARFRLPNDLAKDNTDNIGVPIEIPIRIPVVPSAGDSIVILASGTKESDRVILFAIDGISGLVEQLLDATITEQNTLIKIPLKWTWNADKFGLPISVYLYGDAEIHNIKYLSSNRTDNNVPFLELKSGHNVLIMDKNGIRRSWGIWVKESGKWPKPDWLFSENRTANNNTLISNYDILYTIEETINFLKLKIDNLNNFLENKERERAQAELAYAGVQNYLNKVIEQLEVKEKERAFAELKYSELQRTLEEKENQLVQAEIIHKDAIKYSSYWHKSSLRKVQRVLILSHMFPHPNQKLSGPFVHEQVKALRDYEGIDARVISCRPYWLNGLNLFRIWKASRLYPQFLENVDWTSYEGVPVLYPFYRTGFPIFNFFLYGWTYTAAVMSVIERVWREFKFDIVHAHTGYMDGTAGLSVSNYYKVPLVITEHTNPFSYLSGKPIIKQLTLRAIAKAQRVWCVSDALAKEVRSFYSKDEIGEHIKVLYNGVPMDNFYYSHLDNAEKKNLCLVYVGFLEDYKNPKNLIEAFAKVKAIFHTVSLKIVGDGSRYQEIKKCIAELGLNDCCFLLGAKPRGEVARIMREECDIFVLPSKSETFGVVLVEAMACGKPVVATKCGGPESIITAPFIGELCENDNSDALAESIIKVIKNIGNYDPVKIRDHALKNFDYRVIAADLVAQYQEVDDE